MARLATSPPSVSDFDVHTVSKTYADHVHHCLEMVVQRLIFELNQTDEANTTPLGIMAFDAAAVADITIVLGGTGSASGQIRTIPDATSPIGTSTASQTGPSNPSSTPSSTSRRAEGMNLIQSHSRFLWRSRREITENLSSGKVRV
jgi:hypothetical protein